MEHGHRSGHLTTTVIQDVKTTVVPYDQASVSEAPQSSARNQLKQRGKQCSLDEVMLSATFLQKSGRGATCECCEVALNALRLV